MNTGTKTNDNTDGERRIKALIIQRTPDYPNAHSTITPRTEKVLEIMRNGDNLSIDLSGMMEKDRKKESLEIQVARQVATEYAKKVEMKESHLAHRRQKSIALPEIIKFVDDIAADSIISSIAYGMMGNDKIARAMEERAREHVQSIPDINVEQRMNSHKTVYKRATQNMIKERVNLRKLQSHLRS